MTQKVPILFMSFLVVASMVMAQVPQIERDALMALYNGTGGAAWNNNTNWLGAAGTECTWHGVGCGDGHVTSLGLFSNNLVGALPSELGDLGALVTVWLYSNHLNGAIPPEIGNLSGLRNLKLASNQLTGDIPLEIGNLSSLEVFMAGSNQLSGTLPSTIGNLTSLQTLSLGGNQISGSLPSEIGYLSNLQLLYINSNQLTGSIPSTIGNLTNLQYLDFNDNQLSGSIPSQIGNLSDLTHLYLDGNDLSGSIPSEIGGLSALQVLRLGPNELAGGIPIELMSLTTLNNLDLNQNRLVGDIPSALGGLTNLTTLRLSHNRFGGAIPAEIGNLSNLTFLGLEANQLRGEVPAALANLTALINGGLNLQFNALYSDNPALITFLNSKQSGGDWQFSQTVAPENLTIEWVGDHTVWLSWDPTSWPPEGGHEAWVVPVAGGDWVLAGRTESKNEIEIPVVALDPGVSYDIAVTTFTEPNSWNDNLVTSDPGEPVLATTADVGCSAPIIDLSWGNRATLSVSGAFDSFLWNTGETTPIIEVNPDQAQFFWVTTDGGSCRESAIIVVDPVIFADSFESGNVGGWPETGP